jgi:hypothetical protein
MNISSKMLLEVVEKDLYMQIYKEASSKSFLFSKSLKEISFSND